MSRSYRKPYSTVTGSKSAQADKTFAARSIRRTQDRALRNFRGEWEDFVMPVRFECSGNDVWGWSREGKQSLHPEPTFNDQLHWFHCGMFTNEQAMEYALEHFERMSRWYEKLKRK
jgi:hypothetical protein